MKTKTVKKRKGKKELAKWKLPKTPSKVSVEQSIRLALHVLLIKAAGSSKQEKLKLKQNETIAQKEEVETIEKKADKQNRAHANGNTSSGSRKYESSQPQKERQAPDESGTKKYQNNAPQTTSYASYQGKDGTPYKSDRGIIGNSQGRVAQWEAYARTNKDEKVYDRSVSGNPQGENHAIAYEEKRTLESAANTASRHYENKDAQGLEAKAEDKPFQVKQETLQQKVEQNAPKGELSMEQQMLQLERYENNAVSTLKSYQSGRIDAQSASIIDSVKSQIGYKGSCCDGKLVNALVEYQERNKIELGGKT
jgi:hypothetical protein